jgi:hypothetical protein
VQPEVRRRNRANLRIQFGSVLIRVFASRALGGLGDEDRALDLMANAMAAFRSERVTAAQGDDLNFIGQGSGLDVPPIEDGNWFTPGRAGRVQMSLPPMAGVLRLFRSGLRRQRPGYQPASVEKRS